MANKKNNKQFRETEARMINATIELLQNKSMEELSVREICQVAMVNRSTFYAHFKDKDNLIDHIAMSLRLELIKDYKVSHLMHKGIKPFSEETILIFVRFIKKNKIFYKGALQKNKLFPIDQYTSFYNQIYDAVNIECTLKNTYMDKEEFLYYLAGFQGILTMIIGRWIDKGCQETPETITKIIIECIPTIWKEITKHYRLTDDESIQTM